MGRRSETAPNLATPTAGIVQTADSFDFMPLIRVIDDFFDENPNNTRQIGDAAQTSPSEWYEQNLGELKQRVFSGNKAGGIYARAQAFAREKGQAEALDQIIDMALELQVHSAVLCTQLSIPEIHTDPHTLSLMADYHVRWSCLAGVLLQQGAKGLTTARDASAEIIQDTFFPNKGENNCLVLNRWLFPEEPFSERTRDIIYDQGITQQLKNDYSDWLADYDNEQSGQLISPNLFLTYLRSGTRDDIKKEWDDFVCNMEEYYRGWIPPEYLEQQMAPLRAVQLQGGSSAIDLKALHELVLERLGNRNPQQVLLSELIEICPEIEAAAIMVNETLQRPAELAYPFNATQQAKALSKAAKQTTEIV